MDIETQKRKNFSYDEYSDSLIISNRQENEIVRENFEVGDIIFSLTGRGKIVGIEIREFSSFLENCNIELDLKSIGDVEFSVMPKKDTIFLVLKIKSLDNNVLLSKNIPLVVPLFSR